MQLGIAMVTVPRANRQVGTIARPSLWQRLFYGMPPAGDPVKHFTILAGGIWIADTESEFVDAVSDQMIADTQRDFYKRDHRIDLESHQAFIFVHGYRTTFEDALYRVAQIAYDLGQDGVPFGTPFLYSWPSAGNLHDYIYDAESAQLSVANLRQFIKLVAEKSGARRIHLIAHSMGNRPLLAALDDIASFSGPAGWPKETLNSPYKIYQVIFASPDMDARQFSQLVGHIRTQVEGMTLYASSSDIAMKAARRAYRGSPRAGDVPIEGPIIVKGVDTIDVSQISTDIIAAGHSEYAERNELLSDMAGIMWKGLRPPHLRSSRMKQVDSKGGAYWLLSLKQSEWDVDAPAPKSDWREELWRR